MNSGLTGKDALLVGIDAGTTNTKVLVTDAQGRVVAMASEPTPITYPAPEWAEYEAETLWQVVARALRAALAGIDDPGRVAGIAIASMAETAVPLDAQGKATGPAIAWFDKRTRPQLAHLEERIGATRLFEISGLSPEPIFGLCKLLWHRDNRPEAFARTVRWLNIADYLAWRLCGEMATDYSLACRTYALDIHKLAWSDEILGALDVPASIMAPLARSGQALGRVSAEGAAATGLPRSCMVSAGGHDHIVGGIAAHAMRPGVMLLSTGTTEALVMGVEQAGTDPALASAGYTQGVSFVDRPVIYVMGGVFTAGGAIEWFRKAMGGDADYETLVAEAAAAPAGSLGTMFLPQLRLGTPPLFDRHARGAFLGLSTDATRGTLFRSVLEGIAADSRLCGEGMARILNVDPPSAIRVIGGITRNALYMKIKAAMLGRSIEVLDLPDSVPHGAALLAGLGAGVYPDLASGLAARQSTRSEVGPEPELAAFYDRLVREAYEPAARTVQPLHLAAQAVTSGPPR